MPVKSEKELPEIHRATWLKALSAMQLKNYGYAIQLAQTLLKFEPDFLQARQLARKAAVAKSSGKKGLFGMSTSSVSVMSLKSAVKKDPKGGIEAIEKALEGDPYHQQANLLLRDVAMSLNQPELASFALETIVEGHPKDSKMLHELASHYVKVDEPEKAVDVYNRIVDMVPTDLVAIKGGKDASARASMKSGGWDKQDTTYRDLIRDKEAAVSMEQENRVVKSDDMIDRQLAELGKKYEENPENIDVAKQIAALYEQKEDLENAVTWFVYAANLSNNTDTSLVRKATDLRIKQFDFAIKEFEDFIAANPGTPEAEQAATDLERIHRERAAMSLDDARKRVERNPTDLNFRFELGEILVNTGNYKDAIPELQKARQNPSVRLRAMNLLGKCFVERSMNDLAAKTYEDALSELAVMDATKKELLYNLGLVYERMGNAEKSISCMKQIYEVDYGYRDVAERVEGSYGG